MKFCKKCGFEKPESEFHIRKGKISSPCKECEKKARKIWFDKNADRVRQVNRDWQEKNKARRPERQRQCVFGLSPENFNQIFEKQSGACAICRVEFLPPGNPKKFLVPHIDHCHFTGKIRGLLCGLCNRMLGLSKDSPETLRNAAKYLEESR